MTRGEAALHEINMLVRAGGKCRHYSTELANNFVCSAGES
jgi:hypothetical protein